MIMSNVGFLSGKDDSAVNNLLSQATDLYVLEQVAAINCPGFTGSALPTNLETRFRRLKSLPGSRPDPKKFFSHSKSLASSASAFSGDEKRNFSGIKRDPSAKPGFEKNPRGETSGDFLDSGKIRSSSSKFSGEGSKIFSPTTQTLKLPKEKLRISSSSFTSIDLASPSSDLDPKERSNRKSKSKSKFSLSWFDKLSPSQAMGCLWRSPPSTLSSNSKKTMSSSRSFTTFPSRGKDDEFLSNFGELSVEEQRKMLKKAIKESQRMRREAAEIIKTGK